MSDLTPRQAADELTAFIDRWLPSIQSVRDALAVVAQAETKTQDANTTLMAAQTKTADAERRLADVEQSIQTKQASLSAALAKLEAETDSRLKKSLDAYTAKEAMAIANIKAAQDTLNSLNASISDAQTHRASIEDDIAAASARLDAVREHITQLQQGVASLVK